MRHPAAQGECDANQAELTKLYQAMGCSVQDLHSIGGGCPDAMVGLVGRTELVEFKTEDGEQNLAQKRFCRYWRGSKIRIIRTQNDVYAHVAEVRKQARREI